MGRGLDTVVSPLGDQDPGRAGLGSRPVGVLLGRRFLVILPHHADVVLLPELVQLLALRLQLLGQGLDDFVDLQGWKQGGRESGLGCRAGTSTRLPPPP